MLGTFFACFILLKYPFMSGRLVTAEINLNHFAHNFKSICNLVGPKTKIMAMVKGNAYGHGDIEISKSAIKLGANYLGVACLYEAKRLRDAKITTPILLVGYTDPADFPTAFDLNLELNIMDESSLAALNKLARRQNKIAKIHVKIDTGMHRLGISPETAQKFIPQIENYKNIKLVGIYSHFASSDEKNLSFTRQQLKVFKELIFKLVSSNQLLATSYHIANSAATLRLPESYLDMVRPGKILYGIPPSLEFKMPRRLAGRPFQPQPVLCLKTQIVQIQKIKKGDSVGYNRTFVAKKDTIVATLPVGYGDGFRRAPKNWGQVLVNGHFSSLIGRISMDQTTIDVTRIHDVSVGSEVVLIGRQGQKEITAWDVAQSLGTSSYEVLTSLASRVTRKYIR